MDRTIELQQSKEQQRAAEEARRDLVACQFQWAVSKRSRVFRLEPTGEHLDALCQS